MKTIKFAAIAAVAALSGCHPARPTPTPMPTKSATIVDLDGWGIRKVCIDGTSYLIYSHTLVVQQKPNGYLIPCEVPSGPTNL